MQTTYVQLASELSLEQESYRAKMMKKCSELNKLAHGPVQSFYCKSRTSRHSAHGELKECWCVHRIHHIIKELINYSCNNLMKPFFLGCQPSLLDRKRKKPKISPSMREGTQSEWASCFTLSHIKLCGNAVYNTLRKQKKNPQINRTMLGTEKKMHA